MEKVMAMETVPQIKLPDPDSGYYADIRRRDEQIRALWKEYSAKVPKKGGRLALVDQIMEKYRLYSRGTVYNILRRGGIVNGGDGREKDGGSGDGKE